MGDLKALAACLFWQPATTSSLGNVTGELKGGQKRVTILVGRETMFFLASPGAVMQLKCGSAALGIVNHFNSLNAEDEMLALRILHGSGKIFAQFPWKPLPLIHFSVVFSIPYLQLIWHNIVVSLNHVPTWPGCPWRFLPAGEGPRRSWEGKLISSRGTDAEQQSPAVP